MRVPLLPATLELGRAFARFACIRHFSEPALWAGSSHKRDRAGCVFLPPDLGLGRTVGGTVILEGLVGGIAGVDPAFLRGHEQRCVVDDSDLREKLGRLAPGLDYGNSGLSPDMDFFEEFPYFRPAFHGPFCVGCGVVGQEVGWKSPFGLGSRPGSLTCPRICGSR